MGCKLNRKAKRGALFGGRIGKPVRIWRGPATVTREYPAMTTVINGKVQDMMIWKPGDLPVLCFRTILRRKGGTDRICISTPAGRLGFFCVGGIFL